MHSISLTCERHFSSCSHTFFCVNCSMFISPLSCCCSMAATCVRVRGGLLRPSTLRAFFNCFKPNSSHTDGRNPGYLRLVTKSLNYLRQNEKYERTTNRTRAASGQEDQISKASLVEKLREKASPSRGQRNIKSLNKAELLLLLRLLSAGQFPDEWPPTLTQQLDSECARRVAMWEAGTCLLVLDLWLAWLGQSATLKLVFYRVLLREWHLVRRGCKPEHVTQLLFYVGLAKEAPEPLMRLAEKWLECSAASLTQEELGIVCQGFFKTSTKMTSGRLLAAVSARVEAMATTGSPEADVLVSFLKVLRHARHEDPELCAHLSSFLKGGLRPQDTPLVVCAHYAAFFANVRYYDRELFGKFEACALGGFELELAFLARATSAESRDLHPSLLSRMKDVARILWAMSESGHQPERKDFWKAAVGYLRRRMATDTRYLRPRHFVDSLHSLALVGVFPEDLLDLVPRLNLDDLQDSRTVQRQMHVLYESLKMELSIDKVGFRLVAPARPIGPSHRCHNMNTVHDLVKRCCGGEDEYKRHFLIGHIPIEGFEFLLDEAGEFCKMCKTSSYTNSTKVALEVVEWAKCMQSVCNLPGLHNMKIRQLGKLGFKVATIFPRDIQHLEGKSSQEQAVWLAVLLRRTVNESYPV